MIALPLFLLAGFLTASSEERLTSIERWLDAVGGEGEAELLGTICRVEDRGDFLWIYVENCLMGEKEKAEDFNKEERKGGKAIIMASKAGHNTGVFLPGMKIQAHGRLQGFSKARNPGQFDFNAYYRAQKIYGRMEAKYIEVKEQGSCLWDYPALLSRLRSRLSACLGVLCGQREAGILRAVLLGEKWETPEETKELYKANGISHVLAISGLHISLLGMGFYKVIRRLTGSYPLAGILGSFFVMSYGFLVGESPSAMRACLMFCMLALGNALGRTYDLLSALCLSGIVLLWESPLLLYQASFQLSAGAVFGIGLFGPAFSSFVQKGRRVLGPCCISLSVSFFTLPVLLFHYYEFPLQSLLLNLLVIPLMSLLLGAGISGMLTGLCWPEAGRIFMKAVEWVLSLYDFLCRKAETLFRNLVLGRPESWKIFLYVGFLAGFWLVLYKWQKKKDRKGEGEEKGRERERKKWLLSISAFFSLLSLFLICLLFFAPVPDGSLEISVLDVGQGDSIYIKGGKGTTVLLDGGSSSEREVGSNRLAPFLKSQGVDCLNYVILTHLDQDHVSGVRELLEEGFLIDTILISAQTKADKKWRDWEKLLEEGKVSEQVIEPGQGLALGEARLFCLWPDKEEKGLSDNNGSLVFSLTWNRFTMVFTGDLEEEGEDRLLQKSRLPEQITVLKAGHHGSATSSSQAFLEKLSPGAVLISCGEDNPYGHPHKEALERFRKAGSRIYLTAERGALTIRTDGKRVSIKPFLKP